MFHQLEGFPVMGFGDNNETAVSGLKNAFCSLTKRSKCLNIFMLPLQMKIDR